MVSVMQRIPKVIVVPAHDQRAYAEMRSRVPEAGTTLVITVEGDSQFEDDFRRSCRERPGQHQRPGHGRPELTSRR
jgi:hypothetical protein